MTGGPEATVVRPRRLVLVCRITAAVVLLVFSTIAVVLPRGAIHGRQFGVPDQLMFFASGVLVAAVVLGFARFQVRADATGVWVRNAWAERHYPWGVVVDLAMDRHAAWAELVLRDDQRVALLAVQAHDGEHARRALAALRSRRPGSDESAPA